EEVWVAVSVGKQKEADQIAGGLGIEVYDAQVGGNVVKTLLFTRSNWSTPQNVYIVAPEDTLAEGTRSITIQHTLRQGADAGDGGDYDKLKVASVLIKVIDNDTAQVVVSQTSGNSLVFERTGTNSTSTLAGDLYTLKLSKAPGNPITVRIEVQPDENNVYQVRIQKTGDLLPSTMTRVIFDANNWRTGVAISVYASADALAEGLHYARIKHTLESSIADFLNVTGDDVARGLMRSVIDSLIVSAGSVIPISASTTSNVVTIRSGQVFTANSTDGNVQIDNTQSQKAWVTANVTLSGTPVANETWTITLDGDEYSYVVGTIDNTTETLQTVAERLAEKVRTNYRVTISGSGSTRTLQITNVSNSNSAASLLQLNDALAVGQQWIVKLDNGL
ncbi:MAG: hypothetical protein EBU88_19155, partial [Acidobacteria bacterium]|nr:hypothetical protein [Acidobacteriota bacterium]